MGEQDAPLASVDRRVFVVAAAVFALLIAFSARYGFHRDELYFIVCGEHLQLSYVDQPVFAPLVARLSVELFGVSVTGLRLWPALAAFGTIVLGGLMAREFGGGRLAQLLGAIGVASAPTLLGADHILDTTPFDLLAWAALAFFVIRIGRTGDNRWWIPAGAVLGVGLANKHSIGFFALALIIGTVASGGGRLLVNRYCLCGLAIALACAVPDLIWQAQHNWATIAMTRVLGQENGGLGNAIGFIFSQLFMAAPPLIPVWIAGLRFLWRSDRPLWRWLAWSWGILVVFFAATSGAKPYYVAATYFFLLAAGAVCLEQRWAEIRPLFLIGVPISFLVALPIVLPVLPAGDIGWTRVVNPVPTESVGWPELVGSVTRVWDGLPPAQRANAVIYTEDYGEAAAIDELGHGLPQAVSGHNTFWWWGPGNPHASTVIAVLPGPKDNPGWLLNQLKADFAHVTQAATLTNQWHLANQEYGGHIYICTGPRHPWSALWPTFRLYA
jgi:4-amino-4-deoxy-L-arabinose transferase-like glycosyltransferase